MIEQKKEYNVLVHCSLPILKEGFESFLENFPLKINASYQDLSVDLMYKINPDLDAIILLEDEADADFGLCCKVNLFSGGVPMLIIMPEAPIAYIEYLLSMNSVHVLTIPFNVNSFNDAMRLVLNLGK